MNRTEHRSGAAAAALGVAYATGMPPVAAGLLTVGALTSAMWPDTDNARWFRRVDSALPDEVLGNGGPLNHRGLLHWWGWPALAYVAALPLAGPWWVLAVAHGLIVGVASHLALDAVFGRPGIPLLPWWGHVGVGVRNDSWIAKVTHAAFPAVFVGLVFAITTGTTIDPTALGR